VQVVEEQEDKFEVDADWLLPQVAVLVPDGGRLDQDVYRLENTYFDTAGAGLRVFGVTLRRRVGGSETGWQLKVPHGTARTELQSGSRAKKLPTTLAEGVTGLQAGESLDPVATVMTTRTAYRILDAADELVLEIADDQVESGLPDGKSMLHSWREVEVELGPAGKQKDARRARKLLTAAGATPSTIRTKLDRALGPVPTRDGQGSAESGKITSGTVGELVASYLATQCDVLACNDVGLRTGAPVVHKTRVAARRLRSTVRIFGDVFGEEQAQELNAEVAWYAELLGQVRDRDVLSARLTRHLGDLPPEQIRGPVEAEITKALASERDDATQRLSRGMRSQRYQHLLMLLRTWKSSPPLSDAAGSKSKTATGYEEGQAEGEQATAERQWRHRGTSSGTQGDQAAALCRRARRAGRQQGEERREGCGRPADPARRASRCRGLRKIPCIAEFVAQRRNRRERIHLRHPDGRRAASCDGYSSGTEELVRHEGVVRR